MNTQSKAIRAIKRLAAIAKKHSKRKSSQTSQPSVSVTQPCINKLYSLDVEQAGAIRKNVVARYAGRSKSGRFMKFEPLAFFTAAGFPIHLLCFDKLPLQLIELKQDLFHPLPQAA